MVDILYIEKLESEIERLESEIERFSNTYKNLALACAKGSTQRQLVLNETSHGWQDEKVFTSWGKLVLHDATSRKHLLERLTEANVAHLRKKNSIIESSKSKVLNNVTVETLTIEYIKTEYGPPPEGVPTKTYRGMTYYVY